jgi:uncharacterized protein
MNEPQSAISGELPLILRIAHFPLVALVIAVLFYALAGALGVVFGNLLPPLGKSYTAVAQAAINIALLVAVYKLTIAPLGARPRDDLPAAGSLSGLGRGTIAGAALFSLIVGVAALLGVYHIVGKGDASGLLLTLTSSAILPAFTEELLFRGILFRWIEEFGGSWAGLVLSSALFGIVHILNPGATWFSSFAVAVEAGLLLGGAYMLTRSLWMPIGLHAAWNFTQGAVFGLPVSGIAEQGLLAGRLTGPAILSGGGFGLEASIITLMIATAAGAWFVWQAVRRGRLVEPGWMRRRA